MIGHHHPPEPPEDHDESAFTDWRDGSDWRGLPQGARWRSMFGEWVCLACKADGIAASVADAGLRDHWEDEHRETD